MRIVTKYSSSFKTYMISNVIINFIIIIGLCFGLIKLLPYAIQSITAPNEAILDAIYEFMGWINWVERGVSLGVCIWVFIEICPLIYDEGSVFWVNGMIWCGYRILIAIVKHYVTLPIVFWIILGIEAAVIIVPFIIVVVSWLVQRHKILKEYKSKIMEQLKGI